MEKKEQILSEGAKSSYQKTLFILIVVALIVIGGYIFLKPSSPTGALSSDLPSIDYKELRADIVDVKSVEKGDLVGISLADLEEYRIVHFRYNSKPLMAYIDNNGNIVTAIAMCEPCRNDHDFFIQDNLLVCGRCWTKWTLTTHEGVSGGCKSYPPDLLTNEIIGGGVFVKKIDVVNWMPRT